MIPLSHNLQNYADNWIELNEFEPGEISAEVPLFILKYAHLFGATDEEVYLSLPVNLKKILVIDDKLNITGNITFNMNLLESPEFLSRVLI